MPRLSTCCVRNCTDTKSPRHRFPNPKKDQDLLLKWVARIKHPRFAHLTPVQIYKSYYVCDKHFTTGCRIPDSKKLKRNVLPTSFLPGTAIEHPTNAEAVDVDTNTSNLDGDTSALPDSPVLELPSSFSTPQVVEGSRKVSALHLFNTTRQRHLKPQDRKMYMYVKTLHQKAADLRRQRASFKKRLQCANAVAASGQFQKLSSSVNEATYDFILSQMRNQKLKPKGRRYTLHDKIFALSLLKQSGKGYRLLSKIFALPSRSALLALLRRLPFDTGINEEVFTCLREQVATFKEREKYCVLLFDEMAIAPGLAYNRISDKIEGFEDYGQEDRRPSFAGHALCFMIQLIAKKFKQPIAFYYSGGSVPSHTLANLITNIIRKLMAIGLKIVATVCDQGASNQAALNILRNRTREYCIKANMENIYQGFLVDNCEILPLFDPPHLLKCIRNNMLNKNVHFIQDGKNKIARWNHVIQVYELDIGDEDTKLIPKLTDFHIYPDKIKKMKVSCCSQVFSRTLSATMRKIVEWDKRTEHKLIDVTATDTADFLLFMDKLFDSVNGTSTRQQPGKPLRTAIMRSSPHISFWTEAIQILRSIRFFDTQKQKFCSIPSVKNWITTIQNFNYLFQTLEKKDFRFIITRNLNQDPLENMFGAIRSHGIRSVNPTATAFKHSFKTQILNKCLWGTSQNKNCEDDTSKMINTLEMLVTQTKTLEVRNIQSELLPVLPPTLYTRRKSRTSEATKVYISGFLARRILRSTKGCDTCKQYLVRDVLTSTNNFQDESLIDARQYSNHILCRPNTFFSYLFSECFAIITYILPRICHFSNIHEILKNYLAVHVNFNPIKFCQRHDLETLICKNVIDITVQTWISKVNNILRGQDRKFERFMAKYKCSDPIKNLAYEKHLSLKHIRRRQLH